MVAGQGEVCCAKGTYSAAYVRRKRCSTNHAEGLVGTPSSSASSRVRTVSAWSKAASKVSTQETEGLAFHSRRYTKAEPFKLSRSNS